MHDGHASVPGPAAPKRAAAPDEIAAQYDAALRPFIPSDSLLGKREVLSRYQDRALWHRLKARLRFLFGRV